MASIYGRKEHTVEEAQGIETRWSNHRAGATETFMTTQQRKKLKAELAGASVVRVYREALEEIKASDQQIVTRSMGSVIIGSTADCEFEAFVVIHRKPLTKARKRLIKDLTPRL